MSRRVIYCILMVIAGISGAAWAVVVDESVTGGGSVSWSTYYTTAMSLAGKMATSLFNDALNGANTILTEYTGALAAVVTVIVALSVYRIITSRS